MFEISVSSAIRWVQRWREEGSSEPKPRGGSRSVLKDYAERILALVAEHPDWTLNEILAKMHIPPWEWTLANRTLANIQMP